MNSKHRIIILTAACLLISGFYSWVKPIPEGGDTIDYLRLSKNLIVHQKYSLQDGNPFVPSIMDARRKEMHRIFHSVCIQSLKSSQIISPIKS